MEPVLSGDRSPPTPVRWTPGPPGRLLLRSEAERKKGQRPEVGADDEEEASRGRAVLCRACRHLLTRTGERTEVNGQTEHVCVNPSGIPFHIACYRIAPGCVPWGKEESYWSWFEGYRWQIALCGSCRAHVGWRFAGEASFHGLIVARVVEDEEPQ